VNGTAQSVSSLVRTLGPTLGGGILSATMKWKALPVLMRPSVIYLVMGVCMGLAFLLGQTLPEWVDPQFADKRNESQTSENSNDANSGTSPAEDDALPNGETGTHLVAISDSDSESDGYRSGGDGTAPEVRGSATLASDRPPLLLHRRAGLDRLDAVSLSSSEDGIGDGDNDSFVIEDGIDGEIDWVGSEGDGDEIVADRGLDDSPH